MKKQAQIFHFDLYGKRDEKYDFLDENSISSIEWTELKPEGPNYFFTNKNFDGQEEYERGFKVDELFPLNASGIKTQRDDASIKFTQEECDEIKNDFLSLNNEQLVSKYGFKDVRDWTIDGARIDLQTNKVIANKICYRPFDFRYMNYTGKTKGVQGYPRLEIMKHLLNENIAILFPRQAITGKFGFFVSKGLTDINYTGTAGQFGSGLIFPLYLYSESFGKEERTTNLNEKVVADIGKRLGLKFEAEASPTPQKEGFLEYLGAAVIMDSKPGYITANPSSYLLIKEMRDHLKNNPTEAENVMWEYYRNKKTGHKIRRQHIIDNFITDFVCLRKKLVIEIDGEIHLKQKEYDELRTQRLNELGYDVIRFTNKEVFADPELVALKTQKILDERTDVQNEHVPGSPPLEEQRAVFTPIDLLDYIYAVLHSPTYRKKYKEFLKIDFPRVPYPKDKTTFWRLVALGKQIREMHLLESPVVDKYITQYPEGGDNVVGKPVYKNGSVYINDTQYFANVPEVAWNFYIGGYQPAQKWLKDRKGRALEPDDILHYQKIIVALSETDKLMKEIDKLEIE